MLPHKKRMVVIASLVAIVTASAAVLLIASFWKNPPPPVEPAKAHVPEQEPKRAERDEKQAEPVLETVESPGFLTESVVWVPGTRRFLAVGPQHAMLRDADTGEGLLFPAHSDGRREGVSANPVSPNGRRIILSSQIDSRFAIGCIANAMGKPEVALQPPWESAWLAPTLRASAVVAGATTMLAVPAYGKYRIVSWSPDGTRMLLADEKGNAFLWDAATGDCLAPLRPEQLPERIPIPGQGLVHLVTSRSTAHPMADQGLDLTAAMNTFGAVPWENVMWSPDGRLLLNRGLKFETATLWLLWDGHSGRCQTAFAAGPVASILELSFCADSRLLMLLERETGREVRPGHAGPRPPAVLRLIDPATGAVKVNYRGASPPQAVACAPDGKRLLVACGGLETTRELICLSTEGDEIWRVPASGIERTIRALAVSTDGTQFALLAPVDFPNPGVTAKSILQIRRMATGELIQSVPFLEGIDFPVEERGKLLSWSPDGTHVLASGFIWRVADGARRVDLESRFEKGRPGTLHSFAWCEDGSRLATVHTDRFGGEHYVAVWDIVAGKRLHLFPGARER